MLPGYPAGVAVTPPPYPTPGGAIPQGDPARNSKGHRKRRWAKAYISTKWTDVQNLSALLALSVTLLSSLAWARIRSRV